MTTVPQTDAPLATDDESKIPPEHAHAPLDERTVEQLVVDADALELAFDKYRDFLKQCEKEAFDLTLMSARLASLNEQRKSGTVASGVVALERNRIRASFQEQLITFRREFLGKAFDFQGRAEFLGSIVNRDQVIHEILDMRLLPKRYRRDVPQDKNSGGKLGKDASKILEGNSSIIYRLYNIDTRRHAIAMVIKAPELDAKARTDIERLTDLRHRNVIKLLDHEIDRFPYFVITEFVYGDNLPNALSATGPRPVPQASDWLYQLTDGLDYLRNKRILHTNVRPSKIYIDDEWQVMISPFDLIKISPPKSASEKADNSTERTFNRYRDVCQYGSPELLACDGEGFGQHEMCVSDLYSIGLVGYKILTAKDLFEGQYVFDILKSRERFAKDKKYRAEKLKVLPQGQLTNIIRELLEDDPQKRAERYPNLHALIRALHPLTRTEFRETSEIRKSYRRCLATNKEFIRDFYRYYHAKKDVGAKPIETFSEIAQRRQSAMLQMAVDLLLDFENSHDYLSKLFSPGHKHHQHFSPDDYILFLDTFLETVAKNDHAHWNEELATEWQKVRDQAMELICRLRGHTFAPRT